MPTSTIVKHLNKLKLNPLFCAHFLAMTERFELVPAGFLVIPMGGLNVGGIGDSLGLRLLDHLGMNIDDQTSLTEVITTP